MFTSIVPGYFYHNYYHYFFLSNEVCSDLIKQPFSMLMVQQNVHIFRAAIKKAPFLSSLLEMEDFWQKTAVRTMVT